jgi:hypothetical protein
MMRVVSSPQQVVLEVFTQLVEKREALKNPKPESGRCISVPTANPPQWYV